MLDELRISWASDPTLRMDGSIERTQLDRGEERLAGCGRLIVASSAARTRTRGRGMRGMVMKARQLELLDGHGQG